MFSDLIKKMINYVAYIPLVIIIIILLLVEKQ
jgi:hypothetical protein